MDANVLMAAAILSYIQLCIISWEISGKGLQSTLGEVHFTEFILLRGRFDTVLSLLFEPVYASMRSGNLDSCIACKAVMSDNEG